MVAKKRNTLRNKAASKKSAGSRVNPDLLMDAVAEQSFLPEDPKAFLHQFRETKKDKQLNKQESFITQIKDRALSNPDFAGISKSSIRRRKRKMRDDLKPKMNDLLVSLGQEESLKEVLDDADDGKINHSKNNDIDMMTDNNITRIKKSTKYRKLENTLPGSIKIEKNQPSIRNQKGAKQLSINETKRFTQVLNNDAFKANPFGALKEIIKMQKH